MQDAAGSACRRPARLSDPRAGGCGTRSTWRCSRPGARPVLRRTGDDLDRRADARESPADGVRRRPVVRLYYNGQHLSGRVARARRRVLGPQHAHRRLGNGELLAIAEQTSRSALPARPAARPAARVTAAHGRLAAVVVPRRISTRADRHHGRDDRCDRGRGDVARRAAAVLRPAPTPPAPGRAPFRVGLPALARASAAIERASPAGRRRGKQPVAVRDSHVHICMGRGIVVRVRRDAPDGRWEIKRMAMDDKPRSSSFSPLACGSSPA